MTPEELTKVKDAYEQAKLLERSAKEPVEITEFAKILGTSGNDAKLDRFFTFFGGDAARLKRILDPSRYERIKNIAGEIESLMTEFGSADKVERVLDLAQDAAHGNLISLKTIQEARVGLDLEARGILKPPIRRFPGEAAEFLDGAGQAWDVKGFFSGKGKGAVKLVDSMNKIEAELLKGENVIVDTTKMNPADIQTLRQAITSRGWDDARVKWYP